MINFLGCIILPPAVAEIFQIRKIQRFDKSGTDISELMIFQTSYISMLNFIFGTVFLTGTSKVVQTHKFDEFLTS